MQGNGNHLQDYEEQLKNTSDLKVALLGIFALPKEVRKRVRKKTLKSRIIGGLGGGLLYFGFLGYYVIGRDLYDHGNGTLMNTGIHGSTLMTLGTILMVAGAACIIVMVGKMGKVVQEEKNIIAEKEKAIERDRQERAMEEKILQMKKEGKI